MTKIPDKICSERIEDFVKLTETTLLMDTVMNLTLGYNPDMVKSRIEKIKGYEDPIPQPVTDEAKAKALEWVEAAADFIPEHFSGHYDTIKAALSQPVPVIRVEDETSLRKAVLELLKDWSEWSGDPNEESPMQDIQNPDHPLQIALAQSKPNQEQPKAIQKAVENIKSKIGCWSMTVEESEVLENDFRLIENALTHQYEQSTPFKNFKFDTSKYIMFEDGLVRIQASELEALKAENADLRRAVVDLADCLDTEHNDAFNTHESLSDTVQDNAATIAKAKAVQE